MFRSFLRHKLLDILVILSVAFVLGGWLWAHFALKHISQPLILHFIPGGGITWVGNVRELAAIGATALVAVSINSILAFALEDRDWFWGKLLAAATLAISILLFIGFAAIISVN